MSQVTTSSRMYSDPDEEKLLKLFEHHPQSMHQAAVTNVLREEPSWPLLIHLSPQRQLLLNWFEFQKNATLLEIGAGGGSLTGLFLDRCAQVTAVELSPTRSEILRRRYRDRKNLQVEQSDIAKYETTRKFDYVSMVGVLEYAGAFFNGGSSEYSDDLFVALLKKCRSLLRDDGSLILAIENQWGLKYLSGCLEDHYNTSFESMNNYPSYTGTRTFGKQHLGQIVVASGFAGELEWYFPFPDYKFPLQVLSEEWLSQPNFSLSTVYPSPGGALPRSHFFNETLSADSLRQNGLLPAFANSFLLIAHAT